MKTTYLIMSVLSFLMYQTSTGYAEARFRAPRTYAQPGAPVAAVAADFNRDAVLDIASVTSEGEAAVAFGFGNGWFFPPRISPIAGGTPDEVFGLAALDADGDGHCDLVVTLAPTPGSCEAVLLRGLGDGTFAPGVTLPALPTEDGSNFRCSDVRAADFNADGNTDILLVYGFIPDVAQPPLRTSFNVFLGNGDGTFAPPLAQTLGDNLSSLAVALGDFDADGELDLAFGADVVFVSGPLSHEVLTFLGDGTGRFPVQLSVDAASVDFARFQAASAADFDRDGALDLAFVSDLDGFGSPPGFPRNAVFSRGFGDGSFESPVVFDTTAGANSLEAADFDCDGAPDLAAAAFTDTGGGGLLFMGGGDGTFAAPTAVALSSAPQSLIAADFNADGRIDLAAVDAGAGLLSVALNRTPFIRHRCRRPWWRRWGYLLGCSPLGCP